MADEQNPIPSAQTGDSDDVELALETAQRMHRTGDHTEALKWLRRAVNAADDAGDDRRQLELARAAADYTSIVSAAVTAEASAPTPREGASASVVVTAVVTPLETAPVRSPSRMPPQPQKPPPPPSTRGSTAPSMMAQATSVPPTKPAVSGGPPPLKPKPSSVLPGPQSSVAMHQAKTSESHIPPAPKPVSPNSLTSQPNPSNPSRAPGPSTVRPQALGAKSGENETARAAPSGPPSGFHDLVPPPKGAQRVAVRVSARDENLYVVRPLAPGQRVPVGAREAWLFFDEADQKAAKTAAPSRG